MFFAIALLNPSVGLINGNYEKNKLAFFEIKTHLDIHCMSSLLQINFA
jgi:hypothetical protein